MINNDAALASEFPSLKNPDNFNTMQFALQGRIGYSKDGQQLVSFWNADQHREAVASALKSLQQGGHLKPDAVVAGRGFQEPQVVSNITGIQTSHEKANNYSPDYSSSVDFVPETRPPDQSTLPETRPPREQPPFSNVADPRSLSDEQKELWRKLHLMDPISKKAAMEKLGVGGTAKNPWQKGSEEAGVINPGQKWWAPHSEGYSFRGWLQHRLSR
jgi:hypothetical protein